MVYLMMENIQILCINMFRKRADIKLYKLT